MLPSRSVVAAQHRAVVVGEEVTMLLMCRPRDSLVATPIGQANHANGQILSVSETAVDTIYSKLLLATPAEVRITSGCGLKYLHR